ncbi:BLUF domain-containing protein [Fulvivirga sp. 1062]|uniref:BLUF domain-containing protein n=2 Tax=Fulvivirga sedimenti TaxID=2879465 RepID=A0A9X1HLK3_9BACT|nr:BLUF domain-containing protein [Fulvivirga sedimenti]
MYVSYAVTPLTDAELELLLDTCRKNNELLGVTGMLMYIDGKFIQVLEGERDVINGLYDRIVTDKRHKKISKIIEGKSSKRNFPDWNMGFKSMSGRDFESLAGFNNIEDYFLAHEVDEDSHVTLIFLKLFYNKYFKTMDLIGR